MLFDTWEEVLGFIQNEGKKWGWELRPNGNLEYDPLGEGYLQIYRNAGVPEDKLPPKYMELWATRSCFVSPVGIPIWISEEPKRVGWVGTSYIFNGSPHISKYWDRYTLKLDDEF
jgi:hypothetical protein